MRESYVKLIEELIAVVEDKIENLEISAGMTDDDDEAAEMHSRLHDYRAAVVALRRMSSDVAHVSA